MSNIVLIATSLDGYIADKNSGLKCLQSIPNPDNVDMGWVDLLDRIDALVMGRKTFDAVCSFDCEDLARFLGSHATQYKGHETVSQ